MVPSPTSPQKPIKSNKEAQKEKEQQPAFEDKPVLISPKAERRKRLNVFLRVGEIIGVVEQTRLAPAFVADIEKYGKYYDAADDLVDGIEGILQQNPHILVTGRIEAPKRKDPHEETSVVLRELKSVYTEDANATQLLDIASECFAKLGVQHRKMQLEGRRSIRKLRRFVSNEHRIMVNDYNKLLTDRDAMDQARHDVKRVKTSAQMDEFGPIYEMAVDEFNSQAERVDKFSIKLPANQNNHIREIHGVFSFLAQQHTEMVKIIDVYLAKGLPLVPDHFVNDPKNKKK